MKRILLPVDGSDTCEKSFEMAKDLALKFDSEILILTVNNVHDQMYIGPGNAVQPYHDAHYHEKAEQIMNNAVAWFDGTEISVNKYLIDGHIASSIIDFAEREDIDVIIMCTHGMSGFKRFTLGSVTHKVVMHATVPVLVAR